MASTLALLAALSAFIALHLRRRPQVLQLCVWFNLCAAAYMVFGLLVARWLELAHHAEDLADVSLMSFAAVLGFNAAYLAANLGAAPASARPTGDLPSHTALVAVGAAGLACEAAAILLIGPLEFVFSDRVLRFEKYRAYQALFYLANLMNVILPFALARYLRHRQRRDLALSGILFAHGILLALLTISRYDLALVLLVGGFFLERSRRIPPAAVIAALGLALAFTLFYKPLLYRVILGEEYPHAVDFSEYVNWIRHTLLLLGQPDVAMPHGGYGLALKSLFVISPEEDSLAEWFFKEFYPERSILFPGLGYGFSGVWEGYSANGLPGVAVHFAAFGALFGWLERSPSATRQVLALFALILTYRLFRSEAYNFVKTYAWYFVYPTLAIVAADRFLRWASEAADRRRGRMAARGAS